MRAYRQMTDGRYNQILFYSTPFNRLGCGVGVLGSCVEFRFLRVWSRWPQPWCGLKIMYENLEVDKMSMFEPIEFIIIISCHQVKCLKITVISGPILVHMAKISPPRRLILLLIDTMLCSNV